MVCSKAMNCCKTSMVHWCDSYGSCKAAGATEFSPQGGRALNLGNIHTRVLFCYREMVAIHVCARDSTHACP